MANGKISANWSLVWIHIMTQSVIHISSSLCYWLRCAGHFLLFSFVDLQPEICDINYRYLNYLKNLIATIGLISQCKIEI